MKNLEVTSGSGWEAAADSVAAGWVALAEAGWGSAAEVGSDSEGAAG